MTAPSRDARFEQVFRTHRDAVWSYCHRRLPVDEVPDAVAEVFLVTWRKMTDVPDGDETLLWIYGVARNVVRNAHRSRLRRSRLHEKLMSLRDQDGLEPEPYVVRLTQDRELLDAVSRLSPLEQELLRLRTWEELSLAEIARVTGLSVRGVESRLARVRKKLSSMLGNPRAPTMWLSPARREGGER